MSWLVTGGAGYIGAHIVLAFKDAGRDVVVLDDLSTGFRAFVPEDVPFVEGSVTDGDAVAHAIDEHEVTGVVHVAGLKYAGVSVREPLRFYRENVTGMQVLLEQMLERGVGRIVFSSSCAVYGTPSGDAVVTEESPTNPESPYGETKLVGEWILRDVARVRPDLRHTTLRYFNVVGSGPPHLADHSPYNLFPLVFRALTSGERPKVFGDDYDTRDGTCVRDYIHVVDLAAAHVAAAGRLDEGLPCSAVYNVGRGEGITVKEIMDAVRHVTGIDFVYDVEPRRQGDPARVTASAKLIERDFGWTATRDLSEMVASAWAAWQDHVGTPARPG